jgi:hypothetical protein
MHIVLVCETALTSNLLCLYCRYGADTPYSFFDKQLPYGW